MGGYISEARFSTRLVPHLASDPHSGRHPTRHRNAGCLNFKVRVLKSFSWRYVPDFDCHCSGTTGRVIDISNLTHHLCQSQFWVPVIVSHPAPVSDVLLTLEVSLRLILLPWVLSFEPQHDSTCPQLFDKHLISVLADATGKPDYCAPDITNENISIYR